MQCLPSVSQAQALSNRVVEPHLPPICVISHLASCCRCRRRAQATTTSRSSGDCRWCATVWVTKQVCARLASRALASPQAPCTFLGLTPRCCAVSTICAAVIWWTIPVPLVCPSTVWEAASCLLSGRSVEKRHLTHPKVRKSAECASAHISLVQALWREFAACRRHWCSLLQHAPIRRPRARSKCFRCYGGCSGA